MVSDSALREKGKLITTRPAIFTFLFRFILHQISGEAKNKLTPEEIERMKKQAQEFAQEDKEKKEKAEKVNLAENLAYTAEKTINDNREKLTEDEIKKVTDQVAELRKAAADSDIAKIDEITKELSNSIQEIGTKLYSQSQGSEGQTTTESNETQENTQGSEGDKEQGETVDADFKDNTKKD